MRRLGLKTGIIFCAVLLALALSTSAALAYFSDYEPAKGKVTYRMGGQVTMDEGIDDKVKNIVITNTGDENDAEYLVRVQAFGPENYTSVTYDGDYWYKGGDGWYYYKYVLAPKNATKGSLTAKVEIKGPSGEALLKDELKKAIAALGDGFKITVVHESSIVKYKQEGGKNVVDAPAGWEFKDYQISDAS
ncbi:MAG: hypothetical protein IJ109_07535 [Firmicutes bacterium]|nr:hypothetical protein [Bacillota bacterium]